MKTLLIAAIALCCIAQPTTAQPSSAMRPASRPVGAQKKPPIKQIVKPAMRPNGEYGPPTRHYSSVLRTSMEMKFCEEYSRHWFEFPEPYLKFAYAALSNTILIRPEAKLADKMKNNAVLRERVYKTIYDFCAALRLQYDSSRKTEELMFIVLASHLKMDDESLFPLVAHITRRYGHSANLPNVPHSAKQPTTINKSALEDEDASVASDTVVEKKVYTYVEQMPTLPGGGGKAAILAAIQNAVKYTPLAVRNQVEGRIFVSFIVNAQGDVEDVKVEKGLGSGLDEEVARAVYQLPRLVPGRQAGQAVAVSFTIPISFKI